MLGQSSGAVGSTFIDEKGNFLHPKKRSPAEAALGTSLRKAQQEGKQEYGVTAIEAFPEYKEIAMREEAVRYSEGVGIAYNSQGKDDDNGSVVGIDPGGDTVIHAPHLDTNIHNNIHHPHATTNTHNYHHSTHAQGNPEDIKGIAYEAKQLNNAMQQHMSLVDMNNYNYGETGPKSPTKRHIKKYSSSSDRRENDKHHPQGPSHILPTRTVQAKRPKNEVLLAKSREAHQHHNTINIAHYQESHVSPYLPTNRSPPKTTGHSQAKAKPFSQVTESFQELDSMPLTDYHKLYHQSPSHTSGLGLDYAGAQHEDLPIYQSGGSSFEHMIQQAQRQATIQNKLSKEIGTTVTTEEGAIIQNIPSNTKKMPKASGSKKNISLLDFEVEDKGYLGGLIPEEMHDKTYALYMAKQEKLVLGQKHV
jgi:hypothetical protein